MDRATKVAVRIMGAVIGGTACWQGASAVNEMTNALDGLASSSLYMAVVVACVGLVLATFKTERPTK